MPAFQLVPLLVLCVVSFPVEVTTLRLERSWESIPLNDVDAVMHESQTGLPAYRILNTIGEDVYIGGNETLVKLSLGTDNEVVVNTVTLPTMEPDIPLSCALKNPTDNEIICWNFIRIAENTSTGDLLVCGTNAFSGLCYTCNADNLTCTNITSDISSLELVPEHYSTNPATLYINTGSGDDLYGWNAEDDTFQLYSVNFGNPVPFVLDLDTVTVGLQFINTRATFVGKPFEYTHSDGNKYVFLFYRENALEYTSGTKEYSRIARLCQNDPGGTSNTQKFITFTKARLECSIPDDILPYYYDDIQDAVWDPSNNEIYAIFTSQANGPATSALCRYRMEDIMKLFDEGEFKKQLGNDVNKQWLPVFPTPRPRPATCGIAGTTAYPPLLDKMVPNYNPAEDIIGFQDGNPASLPNSDPPTLYVDGVRFTSLAIDFDYECVYFFGTAAGTVIKVHKVNCSNSSEQFTAVEIHVGQSELREGRSEPITGLRLIARHSTKHLVITTDYSVVTVPLNTNCSSGNPSSCPALRYPYCAGNGKICKCAPLSCQDKEMPTPPQVGECPVVSAPIIIKKCVAPGQWATSITQAELTAFNIRNTMIGATHVHCTASENAFNTVTCLITDLNSTLLVRTFTFVETAKAVLTVPSVPDHSIDAAADGAKVEVTWDEVTATDAEDGPITAGITCTDSADGTGVGVGGGFFGPGSHTVTCTVADSDGCQTSERFGFYIPVQPTKATMAPTSGISDDVCQDTEELGAFLDCVRSNSSDGKLGVTPDNAAVVAKTVAHLTEDYGNIGPEETNAVAQVLEELVAVANPSTEVASNIVIITNNILQVDQAVFDEIDGDNSPSRIVQSLESYTTALQLSGAGNFTEIESNIAVKALSLPRRSLQNGLWFATLQDDIAPDELTKNDVVVRPEPDTGLETEASIFLPAEILQTDSMGETVNISVFVYQNSKLFKSPTLRTNESPGEFRRAVGSRIIAATVEGRKIKNVVSSVVTEFHPVEVSTENETVEGYECRSKCVFWDFKLNNGLGDWSTKGCRRETVSGGGIVCLCDHLTNFAVLVDIYGKDSVALDVISKLICSVSIVAVIITLITHLAVKKFHAKQPQKILINLCFALLGLYVVFLAGIEAPPCGVGCSFVAVLIHYLTLAAVAWMAVEAANLYLFLVRVMDTRVAHFMTIASVAGWGFPLFIVIVILAADHTQYTDNKHCFLKPGNAFYLGQLLPIGLVLLFNFVIFALVMRRLTCGVRNIGSGSSSRQRMARRLQNACAISVLLGLAWFFGLLAAIESSSFAFQVIFAVCNSAQGLLIFLLFCARRTEVRQVWMGFLGRARGSQDRGEGTTSNLSTRRPTVENIRLSKLTSQGTDVATTSTSDKCVTDTHADAID